MITQVVASLRPVRPSRFGILRCALIATLLSCGGTKDAPTTPPPPTPVLTTIVVAVTPTSIDVGQTATASASGLDQNGAAIAVGTVVWSSSATGIATVTPAGVVSGLAVGQTQIIATVGTKVGQSTETIAAIPVATVAVLPATATIAFGATQQLVATTRDAGGNVLPGRFVSWSTSDASTATVSSSGLVSSITAGTVTITALSEGKSGTATVTISPPPVAIVTVAPGTAAIAIGATQLLTATARDGNGNVLVGRTFTWSSSSPNVANGTSTTSTLTATGAAAGTTTFTATSEGKSGTSAITVTSAATAVAITSISPATLVPGGAATIVGTGFSATAGLNTVTIGNVAATVTAATSTQLSVTLSTQYPCQATANVAVTVTVGGLTGNAQKSLAVATPQALTVGQTVAFLDAVSVRCNELSMTGGRYLISVFNSSTVASSSAFVTFAGAASTAASATRTPGPIVAQNPPSSVQQFPPTPEQLQLAANARAHGALLEQNRAIYASGRNTPGFAEAVRAARALHTAGAPVGLAPVVSPTIAPTTVGSTMTIRYRSLTGTDCNTFTNITARVVSVTTHGIVLEDNASPTAGQIDPELGALGQLFESTLFPIEANFGNISAYDVPGALDNAGRVLMLFTPQENQPFPGGGIVLGHVLSCDFFPTSLAGFAASNQTKIFYARVPTTVAGSPNTQDTKAFWNSRMPSTLVHESKHLTANAERFSRNANTLEESWLEEATAQIAAEIYSRIVYAGTSWKTNTTYANSIFCDARIGTAQCPNGQLLMQNHFNFLQDYYTHNESKSILSAGSVDGDIYGSAWMFARWLVDQYGGATESTLLKSLVQEANLSGVSNVTAKTGQSFAALLADWTLMLVADDYPGYTAPIGSKSTFPSWNIRNIWLGYNTDFGSRFPGFPLIEHQIPFGAFSTNVTISGAAASIFELSGTQLAKQLLNLSSLPAGTTIRMSILRVQ